MPDPTPVERSQRTNAPSLSAFFRGGFHGLRLDVSFTLNKPWSVLFGPSGAGKSTVLRAIAGLVEMREARVVLDGNDLSRTPTHARRIALVAQRPALFPNMTALQNVMFGMKTHGTQADDAARPLLRQFHAEHFAERRPHEISGGEQQRIAVARAVASRPRLLLLDEPFSGLETSLTREMISALRDWQRASGTPILSVTHDVGEAFLCADEVLRIVGGRVVAQGAAAQVLADDREALLDQLGNRSPSANPPIRG